MVAARLENRLARDVGRPLAVLALVIQATGCGREALDVDVLRDPATCEGCHPNHVREWSGSMHAYASDDPVFLAMNRLAQQATGGALGGFCVRCHAPVAVALGLTTDGLNLESLPRALRGVTCVACHQIDAVQNLHNGGLRWSLDDTMRGQLGDPVETGAHRSAHSQLLDGAALASSQACGACHDVVVPGGPAIEQTYAEWASSLFAHGPGALSCAACHMAGRDGQASEGGPPRRVHDHRMPGLDVALTPWPEVEDQRAALTADLQGAVTGKLCVVPRGAAVEVEVTLDNVLAGHAFPSGVTHARRVWVELIAEQAGEVVWERGRFADGEVVHHGDDPEVWVLGSQFRDASGAEVQMAWEAAAIESNLIGPAVTLDPGDPAYDHAQRRTWLIPGPPDVIRLAVRVQPVGLDIIDVLIEAGTLAPEVRAAVPTFTIAAATREWRVERDGFGCAP